MSEIDDYSVIILKAPITTKFENILKSKSNNIKLVEGINICADRLEGDNIEIFERHDNILVTEDGYIVAAFAKDISLK